MKKMFILAMFTLGVSMVSCKKYEMCCTFKGYDETNKKPVESKDCRSDMSKKERDEFKYSNIALTNYNSAQKSGPVYWTNISYNCE